MNKFAQITVIEFKNGKTAETFDSDNDFRTGTYGRELAGKVRVTWDDNDSVEWVKSDMLHKLDKSNVELKRAETDILPSPDNTPASVEALETALSGNLDKALEMTKPARRRATAK